MDFDYQRHVFKYPNLLAILEEAIEFFSKTPNWCESAALATRTLDWVILLYTRLKCVYRRDFFLHLSRLERILSSCLLCQRLLRNL